MFKMVFRTVSDNLLKELCIAEHIGIIAYTVSHERWCILHAVMATAAEIPHSPYCRTGK
jgi:hypothetical protein